VRLPPGVRSNVRSVELALPQPLDSRRQGEKWLRSLRYSRKYCFGFFLNFPGHKISSFKSRLNISLNLFQQIESDTYLSIIVRQWLRCHIPRYETQKNLRRHDENPTRELPLNFGPGTRYFILRIATGQKIIFV
jgi:hypothetical protein